MYDKSPYIRVSNSSADCCQGWDEIGAALNKQVGDGTRCVVCVECYPGVNTEEVTKALAAAIAPAITIRTEDLMLLPQELDAKLQPLLTDDPVFGRMSEIELRDFFSAEKMRQAQLAINNHRSGVALVVGPGAALVCGQKRDMLVYADLARWEIQRRHRACEIGNLGAANQHERPSLKYKRAFFVDWRAADREKQRLLKDISWLLDTNDVRVPKLISGRQLWEGLRAAARRPFRVVPFFDPGPWGGHWMEEVCDLPRDVPNHAWCFDCVPEENSLLLGFGDRRIEIPAIDLVFAYPVELLGNEVYQRFGAEFPIRFDFLDTMGGGNLSLQVHPLTSYIREHFGMDYTQDESYYMLDAGKDACVYLGVQDGVDRASMLRDLRAAQQRGQEFPAELYVNKLPVKKHDHVLIPAGTIHCSGKNSMVLEISATPFIFTFKMWDWGRLGLDGHPRPIHLEHAMANIQWGRNTRWVESSLVNREQPVATGDGWREERTGLHELEFIETRRHWFNKPVTHHTCGTVNVLNLVEGDQVVVESPTGAFEPVVIHYAETFIVPAQVGAYTIRPYGSGKTEEYATIKAFVRSQD